MKRLVGLGMMVSALALGGVAHAQSSDPEAAQLMCDLTGDCSEDATAPAATGGDGQPAAATPQRGSPRSSQTRGFSFQRAGSQQSAQAATPAAPQPAPRTLVRPVQVGAADLKLTFVTGSAILTEPAKQRLARYASVLAGPKLSNRRIRIEGHTDASGSARANQELSRRRAQTVADFLITAGVGANRLDVVGLGSSKPLPGIAPQAAAQRRVMAVLL